jgi:hypothetical protein
MYCIRPWLYVGNYRESLNYDLLQNHQIGAMLHLAEDVQQPNFVSCYIPVEDGQPLPFEQLKSGVEFVRQEKAKNKTVLIVCGAGISRSSLFAVATLKEEENLSLLNAFQQVQIKHPQANPHPNLWNSLCEYYNENVSYKTILKLILQAKSNLTPQPPSVPL